MKKIKQLFMVASVFAVSTLLTITASAETSVEGEASVAAANAQNNTQSLLTYLGIIAAFGLVAYFFLIKPEKRRKKEAEAVMESLKVGDYVTTIGGMVGKVVSVDTDEFKLDSGMTFKRWALRTIDEAPSKESSAAVEYFDEDDLKEDEPKNNEKK